MDAKTAIKNYLLGLLFQPTTYIGIALLGLTFGVVWPESIDSVGDLYHAVRSNFGLFLAVAGGILGILVSENLRK